MVLHLLLEEHLLYLEILVLNQLFNLELLDKAIRSMDNKWKNLQVELFLVKLLNLEVREDFLDHHQVQGESELEEDLQL